ncbi:hypothetical protein [Brevundimonas sp.]|uniref:hypothetical protein n=1 Tax=Brevundimonas sp. TaxID=1871086 RepID=UPI003D0DBA71
MIIRTLTMVAILTVGIGWPASAQTPSEDVRVVVKFVKTDPAAGTVVFDPSSCPSCVLVQDPEFARDNAHETLIDLRVPRRRTLDLTFETHGGGVRRVVLETGDIAFTNVGDRLTVHLPPLSDDAVNAGEFHTNIVEPGMVLRFEHDDPARRAGAYSDAPAPLLQRQAADTLSFAQREVVRELGLGLAVERQGLGKILIMGFDTNLPHGHTDAPAHMHMHMRWPDNAGTQIAHYYIDGRGLLVRNQVGIQFLDAPQRTFGLGQTFTTIDRHGGPVYSHTITQEGWLTLADGMGRSCLVRPIETGFQSGAIVACAGAADRRIHVQDDLENGLLRVKTNQIEEVFRYDPDTGKLLSADEAPSESPSGYPPKS